MSEINATTGLPERIRAIIKRRDVSVEIAAVEMRIASRTLGNFLANTGKPHRVTHDAIERWVEKHQPGR